LLEEPSRALKRIEGREALVDDFQPIKHFIAEVDAQ
jgi:hypothetical protein